MPNIFENLPQDKRSEHFDDLLTLALGAETRLRVERIVSYGQTSPTTGWYDQEENEWVIVLSGMGTLRFEDGSETTLRHGDYHFLPAHTKHQVYATDPDVATVWLAIFC